MAKKLILMSLMLVLLPVIALADGPVNLALVSEVQLVDEAQSVTVFRLGIWGRNANMTGLDLGLVGQNTGSFEGLQWTGVGLVDGDFTGWQHGWIAGITEGNMQGLQTAFYTKAGVGSSGVQLGFVNTADDFSGLQFGLVNITQVMRSGLQIGLINIINNKEKLKVFPIVNWKF